MALAPINYLPPQQDALTDVTQALKLGVTLRDIGQQQEAREQAKLLEEQYKTDLQNAFANPTPDAFATLTAKYPQQKEAFKQSWEMLDSAQKKQEIKTTGQVYSALMSGNNGLAKSIIDENIAALENAGKDASQFKNISSYIDADPKGAAGYAGLVLSSIMDNKEFVSTFKGLGEERRAEQMQPSITKKAQAEADKAATLAKFAESEAVMDLQKKGWDIQKIQSDIDVNQFNKKIALMKVQQDKTQDDLKRQELQLKIQEEETKRDDKLREKTSSAESARLTIDNMLNTTDRILNTSKSVWDSATGTIQSRLPTIDQDVANFEELLTTLGSQSFLSQVSAMKGLGALSNAEGEKLQSGLQSLNLRQSPERLKENILEVQRIMLKGRKNLVDKFGVPDTVPSTPSAQPSQSEVDALLQKYGGK